jgi:hypothetical protein
VSGVITPNAALGNLFRHVATTDVTLAAPTGGVDGQQIVVEVTASGGDRTLLIADSSDPITISPGVWWIGRLIYHTTGDTWVLDEGGSGGSGVSAGRSAAIASILGS